MSLTDLLGPKLTNAKKETIATDSIKGYVGAHHAEALVSKIQHVLNHNFVAPLLAQYYNEGLKSKMEIVFVSSDRDEPSFDEYMGEMPWLALPFADRERKAKLNTKFKVQGIPSFVIVDNQGNLITDKGRAKVTADPTGKDFPWQPKTLLQTLGNTFVGKNGTVDASAIQNQDLVGIYFSAHWCGPCRNFTPKFAQVYNKAKQAGKKFEVLFVSSDNDQQGFDEYYKDMPWLAVPFEDPRCAELSDLFDVEGIPHLAFVDPKTGKIVNNNGRSAILKDPEATNFPWKPATLKSMDGEAMEFLNDVPCFILFCDKATDEQANAVKTAAQQVADKYTKQFDSTGQDHPIVFIFADKTSTDLSDNVREFLNLQDATAPTLVIMNIPEGKKYVSTDVADLEGALTKFLNASLSYVPLK